MIQLAILLALLPAAAVTPPRVPARGHAVADLAVERPGMVRITASGGGGTACTVVDQLRGPFASAGSPGAADCALDLLLDAGPYRLLLDSGDKGKGEAALGAALFPEVNAAPVRLEPGAPVEGDLPDGKQASFWIHLDARRPVTLRVSGRTAGQVQLWRQGAWREPVPSLHTTPEPLPGQPIHEWWLEGVLDPGDYLLTAYGTAPLRASKGEETSRLTVQHDLAAPAQRTARVRLGADGLAAFASGERCVAAPCAAGARLAAVVTVAVPGPAPVRLTVHPLGDAGARMGEEEARCEVKPKAPVPECAALARAQGRHVVAVHGPPGALVELRWAPLGERGELVDGEYAPAARRLPLEPVPAGEYLIGLHDVPADRDAPALGCALERQPERGGPRELVAWDVPRLPAGRAERRAFNYAGEAALWFEVTAGAEYAVTAQRASCELFRVGGKPEAVDGSAGKACALSARLSPGVYELRLRGGRAGIETVQVGPKGAPAADGPARAGCALRAALAPGYRYALLASREGPGVRGLVARRLPLALERPLPLEVPAGTTVTLPIDARGDLRVVIPGAAPAGCFLAKGGAGAWRDGACVLAAAGPDQLGLTAPKDAPLLAWIGRAVEPPAPPAARPFAPAPEALPALALDRPAFLDLAPDAPRAFTFDVAEAGLYDVGTAGLLQTSCALRTPALEALAEDAGSGRGRNCLVSAWLRPGRYLVTVTAAAPSRGRASVVLSRRPARELARLEADGEAFFRAGAGELVRARLTAPAAGTYDLTVTAQGAELRCRLEDPQGWPLAPVPGPCSTVLPVGAAEGRAEVVLTALPLTVETNRRIAISRSRPPEVLRGEGPRTLPFWTAAAAELGKGGRDEYVFDVPAELDVRIALTNGMLGRLYREGEADPFDLVPPVDDGAGPAPRARPAPDEPPAPPPDEGDSSAPEADEEDGGDGHADPDAAAASAAPEPPGEAEATPAGDGGADAGEPTASDDEPTPAPEEAAEIAGAIRAGGDAPPVGRTLGFELLRGGAGHPVRLLPGRYRLVAQHARGDVGIRYLVALTSETLAPGMTRELAVPSRIPVRVARAGTLRLRTRGDADVRCRVFDARGALVAESAEVGDDWNCGFAGPLPAGDYRLELESETGVAGVTTVELSEPPVTDTGALADRRQYRIGPGVLAAALPAPAGDALLEVALDGKGLSCAIDDPAGAVVFQAAAPAPCRALLAPGGRTYRLRAWTLDRPAEAVAHLVRRPVAAGGPGQVPAAGALRVRIERPGRYRTAEGALCLAGAAEGLLRPCGPEASLEPGPALLAGFHELTVSLDEVIAPDDRAGEGVALLGPAPLVARQRAEREAIHLAALRVAPGERAEPSCALEGGVSAVAPGACFAAAGPGRDAVLRARAIAPVEARLWRAAVPLPAARTLAPGASALEAEGGAARLALPAGPVRAELALPAQAWAVLLAAGGGRPVDLCPPGEDVARCVLASAAGGELLVVAPGERHLEVTVTTLPAAPPAQLLAALHEELPAQPGARTFRIEPAPEDRRVEVAGALRCALAADDGSRGARCDALLPRGVGALLAVEHGAAPFRALVRRPAEPLAAVLAGGPVPAQPSRRLVRGEELRLEGTSVDLTLSLPAPAVVHLRATDGVCVLLPAGAAPDAAGLGDGCAIDRLLPAGLHRLRVRGLAGRPLAGGVSFTQREVEPLAEGVGPERWVAGGDARLFRFQVASAGKVGLGLQQPDDTLGCRVTDLAGEVLGEGCQALLDLAPGPYLLVVRAPPSTRLFRFRPVLLGLAGADTGVPEEALRELFQRIGESR